MGKYVHHPVLLISIRSRKEETNNPNVGIVHKRQITANEPFTIRLLNNLDFITVPPGVRTVASYMPLQESPLGIELQLWLNLFRFRCR